MPAWLLAILGLLGGQAAYSGGRAALARLLGTTAGQAVKGALSQGVARTASAIPTAAARRVITPQRLTSAALGAGGVLGGAAAFGVGQEGVDTLLGGFGEPYTPPGAESLLSGPAARAFGGPEIDALAEQLAAQLDGGEDGDMTNPEVETILRDSLEEILGGRRGRLI